MGAKSNTEMASASKLQASSESNECCEDSASHSDATCSLSKRASTWKIWLGFSRQYTVPVKRAVLLSGA